MAHYRGTVAGTGATPVSKSGSRESGLYLTASTWTDRVTVDVWNKDGADHFSITLGPIHGTKQVLAAGVLTDTKKEQRHGIK